MVARARALSRDAGRTRKGIEKMTKAVCFNCGEFKLSAFKVCSLCKRMPETDDQLVMSLALTDHYFDLPTLKVMGKDIKNGKPLHLDEKTRKNIIAEISNLKEERELGSTHQNIIEIPMSSMSSVNDNRTFIQKMGVYFLYTVSGLTLIFNNRIDIGEIVDRSNPDFPIGLTLVLSSLSTIISYKLFVGYFEFISGQKLENEHWLATIFKMLFSIVFITIMTKFFIAVSIIIISSIMFDDGDLLQGVRKNELYKEAFRPNVLLGGAFLIFIFSLNILKIIFIKIGIIRFIKTKLKFENQTSHKIISKKKILQLSAVTISLLLTAPLVIYKISYPYESYEDCFHSEIKSGGTESSSEDYCLEQLRNENFREYSTNPLKREFLFYNIFADRVAETADGDNETVLNEAIATEGTANDTMIIDEAVGETAATSVP